MTTTTQQGKQVETGGRSAKSKPAGPVTQFKKSLAGMGYDDQVAAVRPAPPALGQPALDAPVQHMADPESESTEQTESHEPTESGPVQFDAAPAGVTDATAERVDSQNLEWRTATYKGNVVGHYLVTVQNAADGSSQDIPAELAGLSLAEDPELEAWCEAFESALGQSAFTSEGKPAASAMAGKAVSIIDMYCQFLDDAGKTAAEAEELFGRVLGSERTDIAGAVGVDTSTVRAAASGNLREQMTLAIHFLYQFGANWIEEKGRDFTAFIEQVQALVSTAEAPTDTLKNALLKLHMPSNTDEWLFPDDPTITELQDQSRVINPNASRDTRTEMTAGDLGSARLSEREVEHMKLKKDDLESQRLTWGEGRRRWLIQEATDFVQELRAGSVPMGAGISGTTGRIMHGAEALGVTDNIGVRAAAIGYLIPIRAHTLFEVLMAASAYGPPTPASDFSFYMSIEPFNTQGTYDNPKFWKVVAATNRKMNG